MSLCAKKLYWNQVLADIHDRFEPQFHDLAVETVIYYLPGEYVSSPMHRHVETLSIPSRTTASRHMQSS